MPGRQAHGRPLLADHQTGRKRSGSKPKGPGRPKNGRVDVLALAEKQLGDKTKIKGVRRRDLDVEPEPGSSRSRRRDEDGSDEDGEEDEDDGQHRRRNDEDGDHKGAGDRDNSDDEMFSDSDGNEWHVGVNNDDEDSDIDSDEAFGESDDDLLEVSKKKGRAGGKTDDDEFGGFDSDDSDDVGDDGADLGDDAIDMADALDQVSSDEDDNVKSRAKKRKHRGSDSDASNDSDDSDDSDASATDSDASDSADSANSDSDAYSMSLDMEGEDDDDDGDDPYVDPSVANAMLRFASKFAGEDDDANGEADAHANDDFVLADLDLSGVSEGRLKSRRLARSSEAGQALGRKGHGSKKLDVPLLRMRQGQLLRVAAADKAHTTLGRWVDTVKQNRRAEHLSFPVAGSLEAAGLNRNEELRPIGEKSAQTELEKTILSIMEESGLGPRDRAAAAAAEAAEAKAAEAKATALSPEELKALVGNKRRQRERESREQARAKRIKKIKSKTYRRIHRREKAKEEMALEEEENGGGGGDDSEEDREAQHRQRALERVGARHRESKWAKRAKNTGRAAWDDEFREGLVEMAQRDEELRRRVEKRGGDGGGGQSDSDEDGDGGDDENADDDDAFRRRVQRDLEKAGDKADGEPASALMNISFMKKAEEARKKANDEATAELLRELDPDYSGPEAAEEEEADGWATVGRRKYGMAGASQPVLRLRQPAEEADAKGQDGQEKRQDAKKDKKKVAAASYTMDIGMAAGEAHVQTKAAPSQSKPARPWTDAPPAGHDSETSSSGSDDDEDDNNNNTKKTRQKRDVVRVRETDLLIKALGDDGAAAEFAREKAQQAAVEAEEAAAAAAAAGGGDGKAAFLPGWGSWIGEGISKRAARRDDKSRTEARLRAKGGSGGKSSQSGAVAARKDAKLDRVVISERHVHKNDRYLASALPHEFETRAQYERSLRLPVGPEWGTKMAFQDATKPRLLMKQGVVLPMAKPAI